LLFLYCIYCDSIHVILQRILRKSIDERQWLYLLTGIDNGAATSPTSATTTATTSSSSTVVATSTTSSENISTGTGSDDTTTTSDISTTLAASIDTTTTDTAVVTTTTTTTSSGTAGGASDGNNNSNVCSEWLSDKHWYAICRLSALLQSQGLASLKVCIYVLSCLLTYAQLCTCFVMRRLKVSQRLLSPLLLSSRMSYTHAHAVPLRFSAICTRNRNLLC
jgi:hypothetical protein